MILTSAAVEQIQKILSEEPVGDPTMPTRLRLAVAGGGCSGFQYAFSLDIQQDDDTLYEDCVIVDSMSFQYLNEATIDYTTTLQGSTFTINNPQVKTTCGCGSSFSVD